MRWFIPSDKSPETGNGDIPFPYLLTKETKTNVF